MQPSATHTISFSTRSRPSYQQSGVDATPVLARDSWANTVSLLGADFQRCSGDPDCGFPSQIDRYPRPLARPRLRRQRRHRRLGGRAVRRRRDDRQDASATTGGVVPADCSGGTYTDGPEGPYGPGDRICFRLRVDFPALLDTGSPTVTDFLPPGVTYESHVVTPASTVEVDSFTGVAGDGVVSWALGDGSDSAHNGEVFDVLLAGAGRRSDRRAGRRRQGQPHEAELREHGRSELPPARRGRLHLGRAPAHPDRGHPRHRRRARRRQPGQHRRRHRPGRRRRDRAHRRDEHRHPGRGQHHGLGAAADRRRRSSTARP